MSSWPTEHRKNQRTDSARPAVFARAVLLIVLFTKMLLTNGANAMNFSY